MLTVVLGMAALAGAARAEDFAGLVERAKARKAKVDAQVRDITMVQQMAGMMPAEKGEEPQKVTGDMKVYVKAGKTRIENDITIPGLQAKLKDLPPEIANQMQGPIKSVTIVNGETTIMWTPAAGKRQLPPTEHRETAACREWWEWMKTGTVTGEDNVGDRDTYVVEATGESLKEAPFTKVWVDKSMLQMIQGEAKDTPEGVMMITCSDIRRVMGELLLPYKMEMKQDGKLVFSVTVTSVLVNKGLADDLFDAGKLKGDKPQPPRPAKPKAPAKPAKKGGARR